MGAGWEFVRQLLFGWDPPPKRWTWCDQNPHVFRHKPFDWWWAVRRCINCGRKEFR